MRVVDGLLKGDDEEDDGGGEWVFDLSGGFLKTVEKDECGGEWLFCGD